MAGRYKNEASVVKHPAYDERSAATLAAALLDETTHIARAKELKPKLTRLESRVWDRIAPELSRANRLKRLYVDFIAEYCTVKVRLDEARKNLDASDWTYVTTGRHGTQFKSKPEVAQYNDDWRKWNSLVAQLGLSPATELRFNDRQGSLFDDDEFGKL